MKSFFLKNLNTIVLIRFDSLLCKDGEGLKNGKIVFWIWSNTESGCMAYQLPRSPAFTLYRVTSVIGSPAIKSLLHLIATIFFSIRQKKANERINSYFANLHILWPGLVKIFKKLRKKQIFRIPRIGCFTSKPELSFHFWIKTNYQFPLCHVFRSYDASLFKFYICIVWGFWPMVDEEQTPSIDEKNLLGGLLIFLFPDPGIDQIFWTPAWDFDFVLYETRSPPFYPWSSRSIIILSCIKPNMAQWSLIVISSSNQPIDGFPFN